PLREEGNGIYRLVDLLSVVQRLTAHVYLEMKVRTGRVAGRAHVAEHLAGGHLLALDHVRPPDQVAVPRDDLARVQHLDVPATAADGRAAVHVTRRPGRVAGDRDDDAR